MSGSTVSATTRVATDAPQRVMTRLCRHFAHKTPVELEEARGRIGFRSGGRAELQANGSSLDIRVIAADEPTLVTLIAVVERHLGMVWFRDALPKLEWIRTVEPPSPSEARPGEERGARTLLAVLASVLVLGWGAGESAHAATPRSAPLAAVSAVRSCESLAATDLRKLVDRPALVGAATRAETPKGAFCRVTGRIEPAIGFEVDLPLEHWTQRYLQVGCGGLCGTTRVGIEHASGCAPALSGEFVVASNDLGHQTRMGDPGEGDFGADPLKRIDFAYRANHVTAVVSKALIKALYGRAARYSYFMGCSDGGREALVGAERFPDDFDGIVAGAPALLFSEQNSFYHAWMARANRRADGSPVLTRARQALLHDAVVAHCDTLSGVQDGLLEDSRACGFDPSQIACTSGGDPAHCLAPDEVAVARSLYSGARDPGGGRYTFGVEPGSENEWMLAERAGVGRNRVSRRRSSSRRARSPRDRAVAECPGLRERPRRRDPMPIPPPPMPQRVPSIPTR